MKFPLLQISRGLAAFLVVLFHMTGYFLEHYKTDIFFGLFNSAHYGIDFFFVLSGFIIFHVHYKDIGNRERLKRYAIKRFVRIYPVFWVVCIGVIILKFTIDGIGEAYQREPWVIIKSLLLIPQDVRPIIGASWTLCYEVLFYLIFGLLIFIRNKFISLVIASSWIAASIIFYVFLPEKHYLLEFIFSKYNLEFALGCFSAYIFRVIDIRHPKLLVGIGSLLFISSLLVANNNLTTDMSMAFAISSFLIVLGSTKIYPSESKPLRVLIFLGDASYSIYITHYIFLTMYAKMLEKIGFIRLGMVAYSLILLAFILLTSAVFYLFIEKPLLKIINQGSTITWNKLRLVYLYHRFFRRLAK